MSGFLSRIDVRLESDSAAERFSAQLPVGVSLMTAENRTVVTLIPIRATC